MSGPVDRSRAGRPTAEDLLLETLRLAVRPSVRPFIRLDVEPLVALMAIY